MKILDLTKVYISSVAGCVSLCCEKHIEYSIARNQFMAAQQ